MDFWTWMRSCAWCSRYLPPIDFLCEACWQRALSIKQPKTRLILEEAFPIFSFWDWGQETSEVGDFMRGRKSYYLKAAHERLAREVIKTNENPQLLRAKTLVYPSKGRQRDHAASLAEAFGKLLYVPVKAVSITAPENYKKLRPKARFEKRSASAKGESDLEGPIVFIDDVLTTGATALAVWRALGSPKEFSATVLAYKLKPQMR